MESTVRGARWACRRLLAGRSGRCCTIDARRGSASPCRPPPCGARHPPIPCAPRATLRENTPPAAHMLAGSLHQSCSDSISSGYAVSGVISSKLSRLSCKAHAAHPPSPAASGSGANRERPCNPLHPLAVSISTSCQEQHFSAAVKFLHLHMFLTVRTPGFAASRGPGTRPAAAPPSCRSRRPTTRTPPRPRTGAWPRRCTSRCASGSPRGTRRAPDPGCAYRSARSLVLSLAACPSHWPVEALAVYPCSVLPGQGPPCTELQRLAALKLSSPLA